MSLADACLVRMTEIYADPILLTTDGDFLIYRRHMLKVLKRLYLASFNMIFLEEIIICGDMTGGIVKQGKHSPFPFSFPKNALLGFDQVDNLASG